MSASDTRMVNVRMLPLILLVTLSLFWGLGPSIVKFVALDGVPPLGMVVWQTGLAGFILLGICLIRRVPLIFNGRHIRYYLAMGWVGLALPNANLVFVMREIPVALMGVIIITSPVITYLVALTIRLETFTPMRAAGVVLGFAGAAVLVLPDGSLPSPELLPIALLAFVTPALWATSNVIAEVWRPQESDTFALAMGTMFTAAIGALIVAAASGTFHPIWIDFGPSDWVIIAYAGITVCAFALFYTIVKLAGAVYLAQVGYLVPIMGVGWGAWFYGEEPTVWLWLAMALVFAGVALVNLGKKPEPKKSS
ncbi:MAG: DMT family transporter [Alphaproteobacteria bacterium]